MRLLRFFTVKDGIITPKPHTDYKQIHFAVINEDMVHGDKRCISALSWPVLDDHDKKDRKQKTPQYILCIAMST